MTPANFRLPVCGGRPTNSCLNITRNPFEQPPRFEMPPGDLKRAYSRRINCRVAKVLRMWTHYE